MDKDILSVLRRLGLNQYESKTYLALINSQNSGATELAERASIPRPRVYDVLSKLEKKGFIITKPGRPAKYAAVTPGIAISSIKKELKDNHEKNIKEVSKLEKKLSEALKNTDLESNTGEQVFVLSDRKNIYSVISDLIDTAEQSIVLSSHKEGLNRKRDEYGTKLHKAMKRGVNVRILENPHRIVLVDDNTLMFLNDVKDGKQDKAAWIKSEYVTNKMKEKLL